MLQGTLALVTAPLGALLLGAIGMFGLMAIVGGTACAAMGTGAFFVRSILEIAAWKPRVPRRSHRPSDEPDALSLSLPAHGAPEGMNRARTLYDTGSVRAVIHDHPADQRHRDPSEETSEHHTVSFVLRGAFHVQRGRQRWRLTPATLFVTRPGLSYRVRHDEPVPDDVCLSVICSPGWLDEATVGRPELERHVPVASLTNRLSYLRRRLEGLLSTEAEPIALECLAAELVSGLDHEGGPPARRYMPGQIAWYAERVDRAREMLERRYDERLTLLTLSREVGMSPFHFCRIFAELVGVPPHRYLGRVRLARAAERLRDGAGVTEACLAAGFNNLGHFGRLFHRHYGATPSRYREAAGPKNRKKAQAGTTRPAYHGGTTLWR